MIRKRNTNVWLEQIAWNHLMVRSVDRITLCSWDTFCFSVSLACQIWRIWMLRHLAIGWLIDWLHEISVRNKSIQTSPDVCWTCRSMLLLLCRLHTCTSNFGLKWMKHVKKNLTSHCNTQINMIKWGFHCFGMASAVRSVHNGAIENYSQKKKC